MSTMSAYQIHLGESGGKPSLPFSISISATNKNWNDFSHNLRALINIRSTQGDLKFSSAAFVLPLVNGKPEKYLDAWIQNVLKNGIPANENGGSAPPFVTLLASESSYNKLAKTFPDPVERNAILMALNDIVAAESLQTFPATPITNSKSFRLGVLRDAAAYRAFHRGQRYLFVQVRELIQDARRGMFVSYSIGSRKSQEDEPNAKILRRFTLPLEFFDNDLLEDRIHCAIGVNGSGKSLMLREVIFEAAKKVDTSGTQVFISNFDSAAEDVQSDLPSFNRVIVFSSDVEDRFPRKTRSDSPFEYYYFNLLERRQDRDNISLVKTFVGLIREDEPLQGQGRLEIAKKALKRYVDLDQVYIPLNANSDQISNYVKKDPDGNCWINTQGLSHAGEQRRLELTMEVDIHRDLEIHDGQHWDIPLSSGQRVYLRFILQLLGTIDTASLVIIDEPENHLHPNLVCEMMTLLYEVLRLTKSIALVATHSAYVVREVPTHCVHVFGEHDPIDAVSEVYLKTLGASISQLSLAVFGDATVTKYHELIAKQLASSGLTVDEMINRYAAILNTELLSQVRYQISRNIASESNRPNPSEGK